MLAALDYVLILQLAGALVFAGLVLALTAVLIRYLIARHVRRKHSHIGLDWKKEQAQIQREQQSYQATQQAYTAAVDPPQPPKRAMFADPPLAVGRVRYDIEERYDVLERLLKLIKRRFGHYRSPKTHRLFADAFTEELMGQLRIAVDKIAADKAAAVAQIATLTADNQAKTDALAQASDQVNQLTALNAELTAAANQPVTTPKGRTLDADDLTAADQLIDAAAV